MTEAGTKTVRRPVKIPKPVIVGRSLTIAEQKARVRWQKPIEAVIAQALASNNGLLDRLKRGVYGPNTQHKEQYQVILNGLHKTTCEQITALEVFSQIDWE